MWGLGVLIPLLGAGALRVSQVPGELWVPAGEEVTLWCRVLAAEPWDLLRVEWVKDGARGALCAARLRPGTSTAPAPCGPRLRMAWDPPSATLSLHRAQGEDAGRYLCRVTVEIPHHGTATGNGTRLHVTAADGGHQAGLAGGLAGALGGSALLLALAVLCHRHWRRTSDTRIYVNMAPRAPKKLLPPPKVMESRTYQTGLHRARGPPTAPQP
ncbi:transmembrane and immunoglobulin domain-containing protein 2 isoform X2 [Strigops habroptila]|uniref:transmembrane and immunoglobulin domain-containing protein 2 isoform X2 n=1 Tax=Strigops habroptila TaxID=2489341 RepID=UPI0011CF6341|nr:transmembrane and immunoglobulin domain-containing protein 2 isoform X2 [Strigops habroptila]